MSRSLFRPLTVAALVAALTLAALPARAFHDSGNDLITVYQPGGLDADVAAATVAAAAATGASWMSVHTGTIKLRSLTRGAAVIQETAPGFNIPMAAVAFDSQRAEPIVGRQIATVLRRGQAVMGATSAALRGARPGDVIEFVGWDGVVHRRKVALVVPDERISWSELAFDATDASSFGFRRVSSMVLWDLPHQDDGIIELWRRLPDELVRITSSNDPWNPDSVLPTVVVKQIFGEFSYRETGHGDQVQVDRAWRDANIVDVDLPLLGPFRCHRAIVPLLEGAIDDVIEAGLSGQISRSDFQLAGGCWNPRLIRGGDKGGAVSRHAWGIAVDINPSSNPYGGTVAMHPQLVEIFRSWGFAWGGGWTFTDGGHFEWNHEANREPLPAILGS